MIADDVVAEVGEILRGRRVLLCVGGGIAAYKACELVRLLGRAGAEVDVALTDAAQRFVSPLTFGALAQRPVATTLLDADEDQQIGHIGLADRAELAIVAPATANLCARLRMGMADDVVTAALLATSAPVLLAPSMNVHMWQHPSTRENLEVLRSRGYLQVGPGSGDMACGHVGDGRLAEPWEIVRAAAQTLGKQDLAGKRVLVTAGPTREHFDPVRFLSNPSSGRMGYALAAAARQRGAEVVLVSGPVSLDAPTGVERVSVVSAAEMTDAVLSRADSVDVVLMAAAVSDYRPVVRHEQKQKKKDEPERLEFERTTDILATLGARYANATKRPLLVGFAAETERVVEYARGKLQSKGADAIVANDVGEGGAFGNPENEVVVVRRDETVEIARAPKAVVAHRILDVLLGD